ncbi:hypothetical protein SAMN02745221_00038 [Thermosyntropha lipolytica DSM 11003]|uniref:Uncharacterized protein n=1 Tax=Thermosyntropha lipolytica DSM 11003 TaxID=1123382 RepID=A0A1M5JAK1_9FIRM|nr:hypothetical protein [Thermosyntropha lipolytica]SHG37577.1 hypothetical protein SAMN02745221_00038 [Thermosyntropha lipolytica DSM 11003]
MGREFFKNEPEEGEEKDFIKIVIAGIVKRLQEIEDGVDWGNILNAGDEEIRKEAWQLKKDLSALQRLIKDL